MARVNKLQILPYACGIGAGKPGCEKAPEIMHHSPYLSDIASQLSWYAFPSFIPTEKDEDRFDIISRNSYQLALAAHELVHQQTKFVTLGGDHTSGIGTWSGASAALWPKPLGLIWVDAHLDSHTPDTSQSGNIHGQPLAVLLGHGERRLTHLFSDFVKILPQNLCIVGVRSYEPEERIFLESLNVRVFYMEEILERGMPIIWKEALEIVTSNTSHFGISIDIDALDPQEAPGVGTPVDKGISFSSLLDGLRQYVSRRDFIGAEIAEFNPTLDKEHKTEKIVAKIIREIASSP